MQLTAGLRERMLPMYVTTIQVQPSTEQPRRSISTISQDGQTGVVGAIGVLQDAAQAIV